MLTVLYNVRQHSFECMPPWLHTDTTRVILYAIIQTSSPSCSTNGTLRVVGEIKQLRDTRVVCPASCEADIKKAQRIFMQLACRDEAILERCTLHSLPTSPCTTALFTQLPVRQLQMALPDRRIKASTHHQKARISVVGGVWHFILTINYSKWQTNTLSHTGRHKQMAFSYWFWTLSCKTERL